MGINFQSAHHTEVLGERGEHYAVLLRERLGDAIRLGSPGNSFALASELGWSWWSALQQTARERLGEAACRHIGAVDAWLGVFVDDVPEPMVVRLPGALQTLQQEPKVRVKTHVPTTFASRVRKFLCVRPKKPVPSPPEVTDVMRQMLQAFGPRERDAGGLQVASLRQALAEAEALLRLLGHQPDETAVDSLLASYESSVDRVDADPDVQALCHLWLTARHALQAGQPMWLVK